MRGIARSCFLLTALNAPQKIDESRREKAFLGVPVFEGDILIGAIFGQHLVIFGIGHQAMGDLAGFARVCPVIAGDDAGGHG